MAINWREVKRNVGQFEREIIRRIYGERGGGLVRSLVVDSFQGGLGEWRGIYSTIRAYQRTRSRRCGLALSLVFHRNEAQHFLDA